MRFQTCNGANHFQTEKALIPLMLIPTVHQINMTPPVPNASNHGCGTHSDFLRNASVTLYRVLESAFDVGILFVGVTTSKMTSEAP